MPSLVKRVHTALLEPKITGPLLLALLYWRRPENVVKLPLALQDFIASPRSLGATAVFLGLGLAGRANAWFSEKAMNNWTEDKTWDWPNEIVVVTGGASGIGESMVRRLARERLKVMVLDIMEPTNELPKNAFFFKADVTSSADLRIAGEAIRATHGAPTILINNAGIGYGQTILMESEERIRKTFDVNTISHWLTVKEFLPAMIEHNHGHVVTISSMSGYIVPAQIVDYAATKASTVAFHEGLSSELRSRYKADKVRTSLVMPTWIRTPLVTRLLANPHFKDTVLEPEYVVNEIVKQILSGRGGHLILPRSMNWLSRTRAMPSWMQIGLLKAVAPPLSGLEDGIMEK